MMLSVLSVAEPFVGLRPFEKADAHLFFGRETQVDELLTRLRTQRFVVMMGASGSGKSSLVRAGLIPALEGGFITTAESAWHIAVIRPGGNPIGNLAAALAHAFAPESPEDAAGTQRAILESILRRGSLGLVDAERESPLGFDEQLLVVVDQFEELFRFKRASDADGASDHAAAFVKLLVEAVRQRAHPIYVVLTMRSEFLGNCSEFHDLPELINEGLFLIPRLNRDQLAEAITGPVAVAGARVSPSLVQRLLNEVGDDPDQLPVLQHALMRMWERFRLGADDQLALQHYDAITGLNEALSDHADAAFNELDAREQQIAEKIFKCLTERGPENRDVRRPATLREISEVAEAHPDEVVGVADHFRREGRSFLAPSAGQPLTLDTFLDISHESLIRKWNRLRDWVNEEADNRKLFMRLADSAAAHAAGSEPLWRDPQLALALDWRQRLTPTESWARRYGRDLHQSLAFLEASRKAQASERRRVAMRRYAWMLAIGIVLVVAWVAWETNHELQDARREAKIANDEKRLSTRDADLANAARINADEAKKTADRRSELVAIAADTARREAAVKGKLALSAEASRREEEVLRQDLILTVSKRLNEDGSDAGVLVPLQVLRRAQRMAASEVVAAADKALRENVRLLQELRWQDRMRMPGAVTSLAAISGQERPLVLATSNASAGPLRIWDASSPDQPIEMPAATLPLVSSADGRTVAWTLRDGISIWNAGTGQIPTRSSPSSSPGRRLIAVGSSVPHVVVGTSEVAELWSPESQPDRLTGGPVDRAAFSPDDRMLVTVTVAEGVARLWQVSPFRQIGQDIDIRLQNSSVRGLQGFPIRHLVFSPKGSYIAMTAGNQMWLWTTQRNAQGEFTGIVKATSGQTQDAERVNDIAFSPDEQIVAVAGASGRVRTISVRPSGSSGRRSESAPAVERVAFSGDGRLLAASGRDKTVRIWIEKEWREIGRLSLGGAVQGLAFVSLPGNAAGAYSLATGDETGNVRLWNVSEVALAEGSDRLVQQACSRLHRALTLAEWRIYFGTEPYESPCPNIALDAAEVLKLQIDHANAKRAAAAREAFRLLKGASVEYPPGLVLVAAIAQFGIDNQHESRELFRIAAKSATAAAGLSDAAKASLNNNTCWQGVIRDFAPEVMASCEEAVRLSKNNFGYRDSRGVALALLDNQAAALEDFQAYVTEGKQSRSSQMLGRRDDWIRELKLGHNPFVLNRLTILADLRNEAEFDR